MQVAKLQVARLQMDNQNSTHGTPDPVCFSNCAIVQLCNCAIWKSKMYSFKYIIILILLYIIIYNNIKLLLKRFLIVFNLAIAQIAFAQIASEKCICKTGCVSLGVWIVLNNLSSHWMRERKVQFLFILLTFYLHSSKNICVFAVE